MGESIECLLAISAPVLIKDTLILWMDGCHLRCDGKKDCPGNEDESHAECKRPKEDRDLASIQNQQGLLDCQVPKEEGRHDFGLTCQHTSCLSYFAKKTS